MLEIKKITKIYRTNGLKSKALDGVSLNFRESEFASILGPSGSGKTTFLNIIGGLDHYTSGDLIINGISTKKYKDSDWDAYRNHRIGFVFQSYNLIPHQTILSNVKLALTLSGIGKKEATRRAKKALEEVGLKEHYNKRPAQLSGGQAQRVAIARALVNDPEILLADEPTGALDSETSVQIMKILKKVSENRLVIMVTHNPELAEEYSTRIITLKDGKITSDTDPYDGKDKEEVPKEVKKSRKKKTKMSLLTSFGLSASNLLTKKARTTLVAIAGSIGIIGIALVLALSNGFQRYVDNIEEETLTSYPLTIMQETSDMTSLLLSTTGEEKAEKEEGIVTENQMITDTLSNLSLNDLKSFKEYLDENEEKYSKDVKKLVYNYSIDPTIYTKKSDGSLLKVNPANLFSSIMGGSSSLLSSYTSYTSIFSKLYSEEKSELEENYELLAGRYPENYDEIMINLKDKNTISELIVYSLGFRDINDLKDMITKIMAGETVEETSDPMKLSYDDLMNVELKLVLPTDQYRYNPEYGVYENLSEDENYMKDLYNKSVTLKIVGITTSNSDSSLLSQSSMSGIYYCSDLIDHIINSAKETEIVKKQLENPEIDVFSGKKFDEKGNSLDLDFRNFVKVDEEKIKSAFNINLDEAELQSKVSTYIAEVYKNIATSDSSLAKADFDETLKAILADFGKNLPDVSYQNEVTSIVNSYLSTYFPSTKLKSLLESYSVPAEFSSELQTAIKAILENYLSYYIGFFAVSYKDNLPFIMEHPELFNPENLGALKDEALLQTFFETFSTNEGLLALEDKFAEPLTNMKLAADSTKKITELTAYLTNSFASSFNVDPSAISSAFELNITQDEIARIITAMMTETESTQKSNLISLGYQDIKEPTSIYVYFSSFDGKENFLNLIDEYNNSVEEEKQIKYSDTTGILMSSVKTIVDAVTYVLIGFVSISLVVSSIMIGVITYISVYERTKEIGVLRSLGASKHNVSSIFNAETFIIGLLSGAFAMGISLLLIVIINAILVPLTGIEALTAYLSTENCIALVCLSVILTLIGGLIPARSASKKDPVEALRTE